MSGGIDSAAAVAIAKDTVRRFLGRELSTKEWRLAGKYGAEPCGDGVFAITIDTADPLRIEHVPSGQKIVVPFKATTSDFASIPRMLQSLGEKSETLHLLPTSYKDAALIHDMLYEAGWCWAVKDGRAVRVPVTKSQADAALFVALECSGATLADGLAYHGAVTLFGGRAWKRCRNAKTEREPLFCEGGEK